MTATVEHTVIHKASGNPVGIIESTWETDWPGLFNIDGCPAGAVLLSTAVFGNVPRGVINVFEGNGGDGDYRVFERFSVTPRRAGC